MSKEYKVLILGPRRSGKTVFLSSMYYQMSIPDSTNFFLEAQNHSTAKVLKFNYVNLNKEWPLETSNNNIFEYVFNCMLKTRSGNYQAFKITYYDYSGGRLDDANIDDEGELQDIINSADILLGLIDGYKLISALKDRNYSSPFYSIELDEIISQLTKSHKEGKIVHLVISKWDLLKNKYSIKEIIEILMGYQRFKQFATFIIRSQGKVRFIPISSVGFNFAELADGKMKIKENGSLQPYNVEMPIALMLLDPMKTAVDQLEAEARRVEASQNIYINPQLSFWQKLQRTVGTLVDKYCERQGISNEFLSRMAKHWKSAGENKIIAAKLEEEKIREKLKQELNYVRDEKSAADYVRQSFFANELKLDQEHPGSLIDKI